MTQPQGGSPGGGTGQTDPAAATAQPQEAGNLMDQPRAVRAPRGSSRAGAAPDQGQGANEDRVSYDVGHPEAQGGQPMGPPAQTAQAATEPQRQMQLPQSEREGFTSAEEDRDRVAALQRELDELRARSAGAGDVVYLRVTGQHSSVTYGGVTVTSDPTPVPAHRVAALTSTAAEAGVEVVEHDTTAGSES